MPIRPTDTVEPAQGMATGYPVAATPRTHCQKAVGFVPQRRGRMQLAHLLKRIEKSLGITIHGSAVWLSEAGQGDHLLIFSGTRFYTTLLYGSYLYDERIDGQHSYYSLGSLDLNSFVLGASAAGGLQSIQFHTGELIISVSGLLYRFYITLDGTGTEVIYKVGVSTPGPPTVNSTTGGAMTTGQTYSYEVTYVDEFQRESSPSTSVQVTLTGGNTAVNVAQNAGPYFSGGGETYWNIYRQNPGSSVFNLVTQLPLGTTTYTDTAADGTIAGNPVAPTPGENDPPGILGPGFAGLSNIMTIWKDRLALNDMDAPNMYQVSNTNSPTQFSSFPLPTNSTDGFRAPIGGKGQNEVTGMASLGSLLAIFGREATDLLYGDDISSFTLRNTLDRGCQAPYSVQRTENDIRFLSDDGVYAIGYENGYTVQKVSTDIDDAFIGFHSTADADVNTRDRTSSIQVSNALFENVNSFYSENRYYLSIGNRTLVQDIQSGGWTDTGWGYLKTVSRYLSQMATLTGSAPETIFLTIGDPDHFATELHYFTVADTPTDRDAPDSVPSMLALRPFNPEGSDPRVREKRVLLLSQYGTSAAANGSLIGYCRWFGDGQFIADMPIYKGITWRRKNALFELAPPTYAGEVIWAELHFWVNDIVLEATIVEMALCN